MKIGIPTEIKDDEYRVAVTPNGVKALKRESHEVVVQMGAGVGAHFSDEEYAQAGAKLVEKPEEAWDANIIAKVKEPLPVEYPYMNSKSAFYGYLHLAANQKLTEAMLDSGITGLAYESYTEKDGSLPLLIPMSEIAGRLSVQVGADVLLKHNGGQGTLLGGVPGTKRANVVVLGAGTAGQNAIGIAVGMGADVSVIDISLPVLRKIDRQWGGRVHTVASSPENIEDEVTKATLVIGAVLIPSAQAPKLVTTEMIHRMHSGSVLVDIAVDQGGCFEPTRATTHHNPTFEVGNSLLYCVANMPGAVPRTSTIALTNATLPVLLSIAKQGVDKAIAQDPRVASSVNVAAGKCYSAGVAQAFGLSLAEL